MLIKVPETEKTMPETVPASVIERLEREWRMIDRDRPPAPKQQRDGEIELPRLKIGRVDALQ
jgi:hypothetical protein